MKKMIILFIVLLSFSTIVCAQSEFRFECKPVRPETEKDYRTWMKVDVAYVITSAEKEAFSAFKTEGERTRFYAEFWTGRDGNRAEYCKGLATSTIIFLREFPAGKPIGDMSISFMVSPTI